MSKQVLPTSLKGRKEVNEETTVIYMLFSSYLCLLLLWMFL